MLTAIVPEWSAAVVANSAAARRNRPGQWMKPVCWYVGGTPGHGMLGSRLDMRHKGFRLLGPIAQMPVSLQPLFHKYVGHPYALQVGDRQPVPMPPHPSLHRPMERP
jgi:hypothetical protein